MAGPAMMTSEMAKKQTNTAVGLLSGERLGQAENALLKPFCAA
jgi:hypothetical protein